ncbi:MAG: DUF309 domain-containing protein [Verrucomicrobiota bacterium]|jgi:hypothetical protein|nr:DUF309 domain-containing protein [Verrucomicrobiota bacterium]
MSHKSPAIAKRIAHLQGRKQPAHLLGWLECFNTGEFYEAHDVLEDLWLEERETPNADFYKGLIQLAGAFVHLKMHEHPDYPKAGPRLRPAAKLLKLARDKLKPFNPAPHDFDQLAAIELIQHWLSLLKTGEFRINPLSTEPPPHLALQPDTG